MANMEKERVHRGGGKPFELDMANRRRRSIMIWKKRVKLNAPGIAHSIGEIVCASDMLNTQDAADVRRDKAARANRGSGRTVIIERDWNASRLSKVGMKTKEGRK